MDNLLKDHRYPTRRFYVWGFRLCLRFFRLAFFISNSYVPHGLSIREIDRRQSSLTFLVSQETTALRIGHSSACSLAIIVEYEERESSYLGHTSSQCSASCWLENTSAESPRF